MIFAAPWFFALFLPTGFLVWRYVKKHGKGAVLFSSNRILRTVERKPLRLRYHALFLCRLAALVFLTLALSRPQLVADPGRRQSEGLDIVLAIDTSASMQALDFELNGERRDRLTVVKSVIAEFLSSRASDRIGMVVFGSEAFTQAPITMDHAVLLKFLQHMQIGMAGKATAVGDALATSVKRLKDIEAKSKIVILLTDGENTAGRVEPMAAAQAARELGVRVYTVGVGTNGKVPFPATGFFGQTLQYQEVKIDTELLQNIAQATGGAFYLASDTEALRKIYASIDQMEKTRLAIKDYRQYREAGFYFLLPALAFLFLELALGASRLRRLPL